MRAFVTGAAGFVGRHLLGRLEAEGDEVAMLAEGVDAADERAVAAAIAEAAPDVVYHLAGWAHVGESWVHPTEVVRVNVGGTAAVLARLEGRQVVEGPGPLVGTGWYDEGLLLGAPFRLDVAVVGEGVRRLGWHSHQHAGRCLNRFRATNEGGGGCRRDLRGHPEQPGGEDQRPQPTGRES